MEYKIAPLEGIKTAGLDEGTFEGWASTFGNTDQHNDRVLPGAFTKTIASGRTVPLLWMHNADNPAAWVGEIVTAAETAEGLKVVGKFDLDTETGAAAYRQVKARRIDALSIGYRTVTATKGSDGVNELRDLDLLEVSVVTRGANPAALITATKSVERRETLREAVARAQIRTKGSTVTNDYLTKARQIADAAKELDRDLTDAEATEIKGLLEADELATKAAEAEARSKSLLAALDDQARGIEAAQHHKAASAGDRLHFGKSIAEAATKKILGDGLDRKALAPSGSVVVGQEYALDPITLGRPAQSLLAVLPVKQHDSPTWNYLRQTVRDNKAAVVAEGALKPTSVYSVEQVAGTLSVVAHLSEGIPRYWLADNANLQAFLTSELQYGLATAVEAQALAAINATSGIQSNGYATSVLATLRTSILKLELQGLTPAAFCLHPTDMMALELAASATTPAVEWNGLPLDTAKRILFGVPVCTSTVQAAGVAHLFAEGAVGLDTDTSGVQVQWSETSNDTDFAHNLIRARCEGRFATSVFTPLGVVKSALS